jgi:succinate dehydrogenase/fumarate reductase-like Fe-S protein
LAGYKYDDGCMVETAIMTDNTGLRLLSTEDRKHISQYGKCINCGWDYMEK